MILWIKSDFVSTALRASGDRRNGAYIIKRRLGVFQVKHFHNAMGVIGPEVIIGSHYDTARTHSLSGPAGVVRQTYPMKTSYPPQEQIVFGVEHIDAGIPRFAQVVPGRGLVDPTDIKPERITGQIDRANQFDRLFQIRFWIGGRVALCMLAWTSADGRGQD